jgi:predicted aldo/keto reductase-like oxidoreductase
VPEVKRSGSIPGWWVAAAWGVAAVLAWVGIGEFVYRSVEGLARVPRTLAVLGLLCIVVALALTFLRARTASARVAHAAAPAGRRRFLIALGTSLGGLAAVGGSALGRVWGWATVTGPAVAPGTPTEAAQARPEWSGARIVEYRRLGRTDFEISDISLGSTRIRDDAESEKLARGAIERGVNYFDTAPDYSATGSETTLGRALKGQRDQMFVATKFCTPRGHLPPGTSVQEYIETVEGSLRRLQTDRVDLVHIHACDSTERLLDPNVHEAFDRLRAAGKARFLGFSSHTPNLEAVADAAIDSGRFDVMMLAYHHGGWPRLGEIIERAGRNDVGVVAMKTLKGARHEGLLDSRAEAESYTQAAFKWVLSNPDVSGLVISFSKPAHLDEYLYASGKRPGLADLALLEKYDLRNAGKHCFQHCGACLDSCPEQLAIDDVLRYRMYFEDYGDEKEAMRLYARLEKQADVCIGCAAPCMGACPYAVPIQERTSGAHRLLTLS